MSKGWMAAAVLCGGGVSAWAQSAQLSGVVRDPAGAVVAGATVEAVSGKTRQTSSVHTNASGLYSLPTLEPGVYTVRFSAPGFETEAWRT